MKDQQQHQQQLCTLLITFSDFDDPAKEFTTAHTFASTNPQHYPQHRRVVHSKHKERRSKRNGRSGSARVIEIKRISQSNTSPAFGNLGSDMIERRDYLMDTPVDPGGHLQQQPRISPEFGQRTSAQSRLSQHNTCTSGSTTSRESPVQSNGNQLTIQEVSLSYYHTGSGDRSEALSTPEGTTTFPPKAGSLYFQYNNGNNNKADHQNGERQLPYGVYESGKLDFGMAEHFQVSDQIHPPPPKHRREPPPELCFNIPIRVQASTIPMAGTQKPKFQQTRSIEAEKRRTSVPTTMPLPSPPPPPPPISHRQTRSYESGGGESARKSLGKDGRSRTVFEQTTHELMTSTKSTTTTFGGARPKPRHTPKRTTTTMFPPEEQPPRGLPRFQEDIHVFTRYDDSKEHRKQPHQVPPISQQQRIPSPPRPAVSTSTTVKQPPIGIARAEPIQRPSLVQVQPAPPPITSTRKEYYLKEELMREEHKTTSWPADSDRGTTGTFRAVPIRREPPEVVPSWSAPQTFLKTIPQTTQKTTDVDQKEARIIKPRLIDFDTYKREVEQLQRQAAAASYGQFTTVRSPVPLTPAVVVTSTPTVSPPPKSLTVESRIRSPQPPPMTSPKLSRPEQISQMKYFSKEETNREREDFLRRVGQPLEVQTRLKSPLPPPLPRSLEVHERELIETVGVIKTSPRQRPILQDAPKQKAHIATPVERRQPPEPAREMPIPVQSPPPPLQPMQRQDERSDFKEETVTSEELISEQVERFLREVDLQHLGKQEQQQEIGETVVESELVEKEESRRTAEEVKEEKLMKDAHAIRETSPTVFESEVIDEGKAEEIARLTEEETSQIIEEDIPIEPGEEEDVEVVESTATEDDGRRLLETLQQELLYEEQINLEVRRRQREKEGRREREEEEFVEESEIVDEPREERVEDEEIEELEELEEEEREMNELEELEEILRRERLLGRTGAKVSSAGELHTIVEAAEEEPTTTMFEQIETITITKPEPQKSGPPLPPPKPEIQIGAAVSTAGFPQTPTINITPTMDYGSYRSTISSRPDFHRSISPTPPSHRVLKMVTETSSLSSFGGGLSPYPGSTAASTIRDTREREKKEMSDLNDRLASYIEKVRFLEAQNRKLAADLDFLRNRWGRDTTNVREIFESDLRQAQKLIEDTNQQREQLLEKVRALETEIASLKRKHEEAVRAHETDKERIDELLLKLSALESELNLLKRRLGLLETEVSAVKRENMRLMDELQRARANLDQEMLNRIDYQNQVTTLLEEIDFLRRAHDQEIQDLQAMASRDTTGENREYFRNELASAIREIRTEYDQLHNIQRTDMESWYKLKVQEIQTQSVRQTMEQSYLKEEVKRLRTQLSDLRGKLADLEGRNALLEKQAEELNYQIEDEQRSYEAALIERDNQIRKLRDECQTLMVELQMLLDTKQNLDAEIAIYRKMLEGEEDRAGLRQLVEQVVRTHQQRQTDETETTRVVKGETSSRQSYQRSAKGNVSIWEVSPEGKYIVLENTHRSREENISEWMLKRRIDGKRQIVYTLPKDFILRPGKTVKIWARNQGLHNPPEQLVFDGEDSFGTGLNVQTILYNREGEERATLIQRSSQTAPGL